MILVLQVQYCIHQKTFCKYPNHSYMNDCLLCLFSKTVQLLRTMTYNFGNKCQVSICNSDRLYFNVLSHLKCFSWNLPFSLLINFFSFQCCCISNCVLIVFVFVINLDWMTSAQRDNAVSSRDFHSLMSLISFYLLEALPLLFSCKNFEFLDLILISSYPSKSFRNQSYIYIFIRRL